MIYSRQPNDEESQELRRMIRQETGRISQRARMILLSAQRRSTTELAEIFSSDKVTVRRWIHRFNVRGPNGLYDVPRPGRPRKDGQFKHDSERKEPVALPMPAMPIWSPASSTALTPSFNNSVPSDVLTSQDESANLAGYAVRYNQRSRHSSRSRGRRRVRC
jgi:Winged helix-turn helix